MTRLEGKFLPVIAEGEMSGKTSSHERAVRLPSLYREPIQKISQNPFDGLPLCGSANVDQGNALRNSSGLRPTRSAYRATAAALRGVSVNFAERSILRIFLDPKRRGFSAPRPAASAFQLSHNEQSFLRSRGVVDFYQGVIADLTDTHTLFS